MLLDFPQLPPTLSASILRERWAVTENRPLSEKVLRPAVLPVLFVRRGETAPRLVTAYPLEDDDTRT